MPSPATEFVPYRASTNPSFVMFESNFRGKLSWPEIFKASLGWNMAQQCSQEEGKDKSRTFGSFGSSRQNLCMGLVYFGCFSVDDCIDCREMCVRCHVSGKGSMVASRPCFGTLRCFWLLFDPKL